MNNSDFKLTKIGRIIALTLCSAVLLARLFDQFIRIVPLQDRSIAPAWILPFLAVLCITAIILLSGKSRWDGLQRGLLWSALIIMVWVANMIIFDLLKLAGLIGDPVTRLPIKVDWPGFLTRILALASVVVLGRMALAHPVNSNPKNVKSWFGYVAFLLALPYPVIRIIWAFGGTLGLSEPGAGGVGFEPLLVAIPWILAAILSLLLISPGRWKPRRFLLVAGWTATAIVATMGPAAFWSIISTFLSNNGDGPDGMAAWVPWLFYTSWFLWAIAAGAATRSYQLRTLTSDSQIGLVEVPNSK